MISTQILSNYLRREVITFISAGLVQGIKNTAQETYDAEHNETYNLRRMSDDTPTNSYTNQPSQTVITPGISPNASVGHHNYMAPITDVHGALLHVPITKSQSIHGSYSKITASVVNVLSEINERRKDRSLHNAIEEDNVKYSNKRIIPYYSRTSTMKNRLGTDSSMYASQNSTMIDSYDSTMNAEEDNREIELDYDNEYDNEYHTQNYYIHKNLIACDTNLLEVFSVPESRPNDTAYPQGVKQSPEGNKGTLNRFNVGLAGAQGILFSVANVFLSVF